MKLQSIVNKNILHIIGIKWYDKVTNECLWKRTGQVNIEDKNRKRKWRWIGHTLRKPQTIITRQALSCNRHGMRSRERLNKTQRRDIEKEMSTGTGQVGLEYNCN
jgi:hypothetical protein